MRFRLYILLAAVLFSTGGAAIKACTLGGWQIAAFRSAVAAVTLVVLLPSSRRGWSRWTWLVGASYAATVVLFVLANKLTTAANTIFLQSTAPLYVLVLGPLVLRERASRRDLGVMAFLAAGLAAIFMGNESAQGSAPRPLLGNVLATAAGVTWGLTLLGLRAVGRAPANGATVTSAPSRSPHSGAVVDPGLGAVVAGNLLAFGACLPFALTLTGVGPGETAPPEGVGLPSNLLLILYLGAVQIGLAYVLLTRGFREVPALEGSLLILLEPALNPLWAWLLQREVPSGAALLGGGLILGATIARGSSTKARR